jgi:hypothetical protein
MTTTFKKVRGEAKTHSKESIPLRRGGWSGAEEGVKGVFSGRKRGRGQRRVDSFDREAYLIKMVVVVAVVNSGVSE